MRRARSLEYRPTQVTVVDAPASHGTSVEELAAVVRQTPEAPAMEDISADLIVSEPAASATVGIWRFSAGQWSVILKLLRHGRAGSPLWQSGLEEDHWYFWKREALVYSSGWLDRFADGVRAPRCLGVFDRPDGAVALWLEDLRNARAAAAWDLRQYRSAATAFGSTGGELGGSPLRP